MINWIDRRKGGIVYGGKLADELFGSEKARRRLKAWVRAGRAFEQDPKAVEVESGTVGALGLCRSNDEHVIALARLSGARVLCAGDAKLMDDFSDLRLVPRPKGKIYQRPEHIKLLVHSGTCPGRPKDSRG